MRKHTLFAFYININKKQHSVLLFNVCVGENLIDWNQLEKELYQWEGLIVACEEYNKR